VLVCHHSWMRLTQARPIASCLLTCSVWVLLSGQLGRPIAFRWSQGRCYHRRLPEGRQIDASETPCVLDGSRGLRCIWRCANGQLMCAMVAAIADAPFRRLTLLLDLCEDALCLIVLAVCARRHLAITLDLLLSAHIAGLCPVSIAKQPYRLDVPELFFSSLGHPDHCGRPCRHVQTCSGEAATGRTGRCQRCAEAAGSSLAAVRRRSRSVRYSWRRGDAN
jgi:hypothetical protein